MKTEKYEEDPKVYLDQKNVMVQLTNIYIFIMWIFSFNFEQIKKKINRRPSINITKRNPPFVSFLINRIDTSYIITYLTF